MNAGKKDKYISIQRPANGTDVYGALDDSPPVEIGSVWAERKRKSVKEIQSGNEQQISSDVWAMDPFDITHNDLIVFEGETYRVTGVTKEPFEYLVTTVLAQ